MPALPPKKNSAAVVAAATTKATSNSNNSNNEVLFQKGKEKGNELWDDSELIFAWEKQLDRIRAQTTDGERREPIAIAGERGIDADPETPKDDGPIEFAASDEGDDFEEEEDETDDTVQAGGLYVNDAESNAAAKGGSNGVGKNKKAISGSKRQQRVDDCDEEEEEDIALCMPPLPPALRRDPSLVAMLKAWYEAGYRTGVYVGMKSK